MNKAFLIFIILILSLTAVSAVDAANASLYLSPSAGTCSVGNTFLVQVKLNSGGVAINAADGTLIFDANDLEVVKISKEESIFSLWVNEPVFSNALGTINFAGGKPSPGFTGASGTVINITFKVKTSGIGNLTFASGSVLMDDGMGTNILATMGSGAYTLSARGTIPTTPATPTAPTSPASTPYGVPDAPIISSLTHSEENKWYSNNDPEFSWELPPDVTGVSLLLHEKATANPGSDSDGLITSKTYQDIKDGVWYFHIKFRNQYGWGAITHRKVLIDTSPPTIFKVIVDKKGILTNPSPVLYFESTDIPSGLEYYEVIIDRDKKILAQADDFAVADIKKNPFQMPALNPGNHIVEVKAFDKAGNFSLTTAEIEITPIESPEITKIPISIKTGEPLEIEGTALPEFTVVIYIQKDEAEPISKKVGVDLDGKFKLIYEKTLSKGDYLVWAIAEDDGGAVSYPTKKYSLEVGLSPILKFGKIALDYISIMITLIVLIIGAVAVGFYAWYRISVWRKRVRQETKEVKESVTRAFKALKEEVAEQIEFLDGKPGLNKDERKVRDKLKEALNVSEEFVQEEIKDVEKELE